MDKFARALKLCLSLNRLLQPVFDRFDVVIRGAFDCFHAGCIVRTELFRQPAQESFGPRRERRQLGKTRAGERNQPVDFDDDPMPDQRRFRKPCAQCAGLSGITAVEWRKGMELSALLERKISRMRHGRLKKMAKIADSGVFGSPFRHYGTWYNWLNSSKRRSTAWDMNWFMSSSLRAACCAY